MTSRVKEDEITEKIVRGLLKLQENRRCINCNSLGPQYVCTTFLTFVCTTCSGVHREFTHRVKSVSMAKFNAEEVKALQAGGNERARQIYFKAWDPQRHSYPDASNLHRIRDFIKHVYVDRKYTGERSMEKLPRLKMDDKADSNKKADGCERRYGERSSLDGRNDDKSFKYYYDERRSPRFAKENNRYGGYRRSPVRFEVVDDRFRDDGFGSGRRSGRFSNVDSVPGCRSPESKKNVDMLQSIVVRPASEIVGEDVPPLKVGDVRNTNALKDADRSAPNLKIAPSSNVKSVNVAPSNNVKTANNAPSSNVRTGEGNPVEQKRVTSGTLIDFNNTDPHPLNVARVPQEQKGPPASNWAAFGSSGKEIVSQPLKENTLEELLSLIIVPPPAGDMQELLRSSTAPPDALLSNISPFPVGGSPAEHGPEMPKLPEGVGASTTNQLMPDEGALVDASKNQPSNVIVPPHGGSAATASTSNPSSNFPGELPNGGTPFADTTIKYSANEGAPVAATPEKSITSSKSSEDNAVQVTCGQPPILQQNQSCASAALDICSAAQQTSPVVGAIDDRWASSLASNVDVPAIVSAEQSSQHISNAEQSSQRISKAEQSSKLILKPGLDTTSVGAKQSMEVKHSGRKELPMDLFTSSYLAVPAPVPHWQSIQHVMRFGVQYHPSALPASNFPNPATSTNPFDINGGTAQTALFPTMVSMQEGLPTVSAPTVSFNHSNFVAQRPQVMPPCSPSYPSSLPTGSPSYPSTISPRLYIEQAPRNTSPSGLQGYGSFGPGGAAFSAFNTNQQPTSTYNTAVSSPNSYSSRGGNPFD